MTKKEDIVYAALELAAEYGLKAISMSQIAGKVGLTKSSLYSHFKSKEELINEMYSLLRNKARNSTDVPADYAMLFNGRGLEEILLICTSAYAGFLGDKDMMAFFKVLYAERSTSAAAAQIMLEETERMIGSVRNLFYALVVHGKMKKDNVDTAALGYAMAIHSLIDREMDRITAGEGKAIDAPDKMGIPEDICRYIKWFSEQMEVENE